MFYLEELQTSGSLVHVNKLNMSIGELINLYNAPYQELPLIVSQENGNSFRWYDIQKSRLIESILLNLPIPEIFILNHGNGLFQLIDGMQRLFSVIQFIESSILELKPLVLEGCELIPELNGKSFKDLPLSLQLTIKRSPFGVNILIVKHKSVKSQADLTKELILRDELIQRLSSFNFN